MHIKKKTKIIATIGPASNSFKKIEKMVLSGLNVCRINFSHTDQEEALKIINIIKQVNENLGESVAILGDLQGPKLRLSKFNKVVKLNTESSVILTNIKTTNTSKKLYIDHPTLFKNIKISDTILIDDGKIILKVIVKENNKSITCKVIQGGYVSSRKGVNLPDTKLPFSSLTKKDKEDLKFLIHAKVEWIALSFVRTSKDITELKNILSKHKSKAKIIAKIERPESIKHLKSIARIADGIMIARGDLGIEVPMQKVPVLQKKIIKLCREYTKPVVVATQMMEGMIKNINPTRAETNDVANAVFDRADALMLSGETAIGKYPIRVIKAMTKIILSAEDSYKNMYFKKEPPLKKNNRYLSDSICFYACKLADEVNSKAIITLTHSGYNAQKIATNRPNSFIYVFTHNKKILNSLSLFWGIYGFYYDKFNSTDQTIQDLHNILKRKKILKSGQLVINIGSMPIMDKGKTNMLKIGTIS